MTVGELSVRMSAREFAEWCIYFEMEPFGEMRADVRAASIAQTIANRHRDKKERAHKLEEFLPFKKKIARESAENLLAKFKGLTKRTADRFREDDRGHRQYGNTRQNARETRSGPK